MVRRYAHLSADHLASYVDRVYRRFDRCLPVKWLQMGYSRPK